MPSDFWGIQPVGNPDKFMAWSHWTEQDAIQGAAYNSERWGPHEVVPPAPMQTPQVKTQ